MKGRLENELKNNEKIKKILITMPKEVEMFYNSVRIGLESTTCLEYVRKIKRFLEYVNKDIKNITKIDIENYLNNIMYYEKDEEIKKISFSYIKTNIIILNKFFSYLHNNNIIQSNPVVDINNNKPRGNDDVNRYSLSLDELNSMLECAVKGDLSNRISRSKQENWKERDYAILYTFMSTGMRRTALSEINIDDISFEYKNLKIIDKRGKSFDYPITDEVEICLKDWLDKREKILSQKNKKTDALFISNRGTRLSGKEIYNIVKKYSEASLGRSVSPHKLRSSYITLVYNSTGYDLEAASKAVGHANVRTTSLYINSQKDPRKVASNYFSHNLLSKEGVTKNS